MFPLHLCTLKSLHRAAFVSTDIQVKVSETEKKNLSALPTTKLTKTKRVENDSALCPVSTSFELQFMLAAVAALSSSHFQAFAGMQWSQTT